MSVVSDKRFKPNNVPDVSPQGTLTPQILKQQPLQSFDKSEVRETVLQKIKKREAKIAEYNPR